MRRARNCRQHDEFAEHEFVRRRLNSRAGATWEETRFGDQEIQAERRLHIAVRISRTAEDRRNVCVAQRGRLLAANLAEETRRQSGAGAGSDRRATAQIGKLKSRNAVAAESRATTTERSFMGQNRG